MILWLLGAALAAPPAGLMPEEVDQWDPYWTRLQDAPPGCWEVVARATWDWDFGRYGASRGSSVFVGKLEAGTWRDMYIRSLGEVVEKPGDIPIRFYPHDELRFAPLVGRIGPAILGDDNVEKDVLSEIVDLFGGEVTTTWSEWNDARGGVVLHRQLPVGSAERAEGTMEVLFPAGGTLPTRLDFTIAEPFTLPNNPAIHMREASARVRGHVFNSDVFPDAESFSFVATVSGYKVWGAQTVRYDSFRPCGGAVQADAVAIQP